MRIAALFVALGGMAAGALSAQIGTTPTAGGGGTATTGSGGGIRGGDSATPIYLSGKVVMEDGSAVPPNVAVERVCSGISRIVAYTDPKGRFNFRWDDRGTVLSDAADAGSGPSSKSGSGGFGGSQSAGGGNILAADPFGNRMMNCTLRASLAGFRSDAISLFNRRSVDDPDVGAIVVHRIGGVEGLSVSMTSMMAPKNARSAYQRGLQALLNNKTEEAARDFEKAVALYPRYADAWVSLARLRLDQRSVEPARAALRKAMDADPKLVAPYLELGLLAAREANWPESGKYLDQAVELDPVDFAQAWYADAVAHYNLKNYDAAEKSARAAVKLDPRHANPRSDYLLGLVLLEKKDYAGAVAELTEYLQLAPNAPEAAQVRDQLAEAEKLADGAK